MTAIKALHDIRKHLADTQTAELNLLEAVSKVGNYSTSDWCQIAETFRQKSTSLAAILKVYQMAVEWPEVPVVRPQHLKDVRVRLLTGNSSASRGGA